MGSRRLLPLALLLGLIAPAPSWSAFEVLDEKGFAELLAGHRDKVVVVDFWATWCPPCRQEVPDFVSLHGRYRDRGVVVIGVSLDTDPRAVERFVERYRVDYPIYGGTLGLKQAQRITIIPTTVIYGPDGRQRHRHVGYQAADVFDREVRSLLEGR